MLVVFPHFFVADTKILYGYNFLAPLKTLLALGFAQSSNRFAQLVPS